MEKRPKTIFCDIDGTLVNHNKPTEQCNNKLELLDGTLEKILEWGERLEILEYALYDEAGGQRTEFAIGQLRMMQESGIMPGLIPLSSELEEGLADVLSFSQDIFGGGADVRDGKIASHGWKNQSDIMAVELIKTFKSSVVNSVIYTDISKDGSLQGVSLDQTVNFAKSIQHSVIASGGVSSLNDISRLSEEFSNGIKGVIVGRALYDRKFTLSDALKKIKKV